MANLMLSEVQRWESAFEQMLEDQKHLIQSEVQQWQSVFSQMAQEEEHLIATGGWVHGPADLLSVIHRARREIYHSDILAWLLDPYAKHGLGKRLLPCILRKAFPNQNFFKEDFNRVVVEREVSRQNCRADIVIWCRTLTVVIEVKIDAAERENQCDDIYSDFHQENNPLFIFLTPRRQSPRTATGDASSSFACLGFKDISAELRSAISACPESLKDKPGYHAVYTYLQTLEKEFI